MQKLELQDILPLEDFETQRKQFFESHIRYIEKYRKVRLGPSISLVFENRQTLWFRVQEIFRLTKIADPKVMQNELNIYNRLIPDANTLQAAFLLDPQSLMLSGNIASFSLKDFRGDNLRLVLNKSIPCDLTTKRPEDLSLGNSLWVRFFLDEEAKIILKDARIPAKFSLSSNQFLAESHNLPTELRESLWEDLQN
ncbi:MAG: DUF3501 family protein [Planctomycetes bacterium]|nr:DUF3501 family protein [Planctomycetota bacterium]